MRQIERFDEVIKETNKAGYLKVEMVGESRPNTAHGTKLQR